MSKLTTAPCSTCDLTTDSFACPWHKERRAASKPRTGAVPEGQHAANPAVGRHGGLAPWRRTLCRIVVWVRSPGFYDACYLEELGGELLGALQRTPKMLRFFWRDPEEIMQQEAGASRAQFLMTGLCLLPLATIFKGIHVGLLRNRVVRSLCPLRSRQPERALKLWGVLGGSLR